MTDHIYTYDDPPSERDIRRACEALEAGGVIAYPTDVNWAFGCDAANVKAIDKVRNLKPYKPKEQPYSLICDGITMASSFANIDHVAYRFLKKIWPGPYTVLLHRNKNLARQLNDKRKIVGIRVPDSRLILSLVHTFGKPIITTSAPEIEKDSPIKFGYELYEKYKNRIDIILDLGEEVIGSESTVVDFSEGYPEVVRVGIGSVAIFE